MSLSSRQQSITSAIRFSLVAAALSALLLHFSSRAEAWPGDLDPSFARGGKTVTALDMGTSWYAATSLITEAPKGALVVIAGDKLIRYGRGGRIDRGFGTEGVVKIEVPGFDFSISDLDVDSAGRAVIFGTATDYGTLLSPYTSSYPSGAAFRSYATVIRYTTTGGLDPTFGDGDGIETTNLELPAFPGTTEPAVITGAGVVDDEDRPVLIGGQREVASPCEGHGHYADFDKLIARLTPAGDLDASFGSGDGITFLEGSDEVSDIVLGGRGHLTLAGAAQERCDDRNFVVLRMRPNGVLDDSFGRDGRRRYRLSSPRRIAIDRFGRTYVQAGGIVQYGSGGAYTQGRGVVRLALDGNLDRGFGQRGVAAVNVPADLTVAHLMAFQSNVDLAAVDSAGRPLLTGTLTFRPKDRGPLRERLRRRFVVTRLNAHGRPDRSFGRGGWVMTGFGRFSSGRESDALIDRNGRLVVAGVVNRPDLDPTGGISLVRYLLAP
ncbi:MAG TPA: hypothetical protein VIS95_03060 [Solirubrobacterales bacterium]